jgi:hypothetical protein
VRSPESVAVIVRGYMQCCSASQIGSPTVVAPAVDVALTSWPGGSVVEGTVDTVLDEAAAVDAASELGALVGSSSEPHDEKRMTIASRPTRWIRRMRTCLQMSSATP